MRAHRPKTKLFSVSIIGALGLVEGGGPKVIPEVPEQLGQERHWDRMVEGEGPKVIPEVPRAKSPCVSSSVCMKYSTMFSFVGRALGLCASQPCRSSRTVRHPVRVRHGEFCSLQFCVHSLESAQLLKFSQ